MTKKRMVLFLMMAFINFLLTPVIASSECYNLKGCEKKFCEIEKQLTIAQEIGNKDKEKGLKKSLKNAKKYCNNEDLKDSLLEKIEETNNDIIDYESDLKEAKQYEKTEKIHKYQEKIEEEKEKIKHLKDELSTYK